MRQLSPNAGYTSMSCAGRYWLECTVQEALQHGWVNLVNAKKSFYHHYSCHDITIEILLPIPFLTLGLLRPLDFLNRLTVRKKTS